MCAFNLRSFGIFVRVTLTLVLDLDLDILKMYLLPKMKSPNQGFQKLRV